MIRITLARSPSPGQVEELQRVVPEGTRLGEALVQAGWLAAARFDEWSTPVGLWGRRVPHDTPLRDGDRVEMYRPLRVDPKVARRERFVGQGSRNAGLFAQRRPNSKAGY